MTLKSTFSTLVFLILLWFGGHVSAQVNQTIVHEGITRTFVVYKPSSWTADQKLPLLIVLHGLTQTGNGIMNVTGFNDIAEANQFIVCYPDGLNNSWNANMNVSVSQANDLGFLETLSTHLQSTINTDPLKQYLCGFSTGGFMSHKMASESSQCFAAIASVSGTMSDTVYANFNPVFKPHILHIHGTADLVVNYNGSTNTGASVDAMMQKWRNHLACNAQPTFTAMPNTNALDFSYPEKYTYNACQSGSLALIKIIGGGHQWPGIPTLLGGAGTINMDFYSPQIIWNFLQGKSCPQATAIAEVEVMKKKTILRVVDMLGRETKINSNTPLMYIYSDGSREKSMQIGD